MDLETLQKKVGGAELGKLFAQVQAPSSGSGATGAMESLASASVHSPAAKRNPVAALSSPASKPLVSDVPRREEALLHDRMSVASESGGRANSVAGGDDGYKRPGMMQVGDGKSLEDIFVAHKVGSCRAIDDI